MSLNDEIRLWIVIPVYENWTDTRECLASLSVQSHGSFRVIVADDGSASPPPPACREYSFAQHLRGEHAGFGANCNRAVREALAQGATHVLLLNDDTVVPPRFVERWHEVIEREPHSILSPAIHYFRKPAKVWYTGGRWTIWTPFFRMNQKLTQRTEVDLVCGCAMLIPGAVWRRTGGFDLVFPTYYEDFDLCLRARNLGVTVAVDPHPDLTVLHKVSGSFRKQGIWRQQYLMTSTRLLFIRRHYRGWRKLLCLALCIPHLSIMSLLCLPRLPSLTLLWRSIRAGLAPQGV